MFAKLTVYNEYLYFVFRILVGLLFLQHGLQKVFGLFGGFGGGTVFAEGVSFFFVIAGFIELLAGIAITLGLFTRFAALIAAIEMILAFLIAHWKVISIQDGIGLGTPGSIIPFVNGGELALLYIAAFLILIMHGSRKWGLERIIMKKEMF